MNRKVVMLLPRVSHLAALLTYAPIICKPSPHGAGNSEDIAGRNYHVLTSAISLQFHSTDSIPKTTRVISRLLARILAELLTGL